MLITLLTLVYLNILGDLSLHDFYLYEYSFAQVQVNRCKMHIYIYKFDFKTMNDRS